jgi:uncharacterized membrane protein
LKYFVLIALIFTFVRKGNPFSFIKNIEFQWPLIILISFGTQIALAFITFETKEKFELILILTFVGVIIGLWKNKHIDGVKWMVTGAILNLAALALHGGLMPVSETALKMTGQDTSFVTDSRHQLMDDSSLSWIVADWIPVGKYVMSPGDLLVGIGLMVLIYKNSTARKRKEEPI